MAIQFRRGAYNNFDKSKLVPGEPAVVTSGDPIASDGKAVYVAIAAGDTRRLAAFEDMQDAIESATEDVVQELTSEVRAATTAATTAATSANSAASSANAKATAAQNAANGANAAAQQATATAAAAAQRADAAGQQAVVAAQEAGQQAIEVAENAGQQAVEGADAAAQRAEAAAIAAEGIVLQAVPTMSEDVKGGAKLGRALEVVDETLSLAMVGSGDGSETHGCAIFGVDAKGWAEQVSTTGKNLLPSTASTQTISGVTLTVNADGSVTARGTATNSFTYDYHSYTSDGFLTISAGTYTLSGCPSDGSSSTWKLDIESTEGVGFLIDFGSGATRTIASETKIKRCRIVIYSGATIDATFYPQLETGSIATSYEPYSGGVPSPSPERPQPISMVRGRNMAAPSDTSNMTSNGIAWTYLGDNRWKANGTATGASNIIKAFDCGVLTAGNYTASARVVGGSGSIACRVGKGDSSAYVGESDTKTSLATYTFAADGSTRYWVAPYVKTNQTVTNAVIAIQLERGLAATPYVPYGHVGLEVHGKNLVPINAGKTDSRSGVTSVVNTDGSVLLSGTSTAEGDLYIYGGWMASALELDLTPGDTYALSIVRPNDKDVKAKVYCFDSANAVINGYTTSDGATTFTVPSNAAKYGVSVRVPAGVNVDGVTVRVQLEHGAEVTAYGQYTNTVTPIPLPQKGFAASLPDGTADALSVDSAGRVEWASSVGMEVYDGSNMSGWTVSGNYASSGGGFYNQTLIPGSTRPASVCFVSNLPYIGQMYNANDYSGKVGFGQTLGAFRVRPEETSEAQTIKKFAAWLASNPITVLHPLASPTTESTYIDLPALTDGASVDIPELTAIGVRWFAVGTEAAIQHATNERRRIEEELDAIREAIADL